MTIEIKLFSACTNQDIFDFYCLRSAVFVVEQNCVYQDVDKKDLVSHHVLLRLQDKLGAYCRIIPPGKAYPETSIGRVVVAGDERGKGYGKILMAAAIREAFKQFPHGDVVISAQQYLEKFYQDMGFISEGAPYLEDNIPHIHMRLKPGDRK